MAAGQPGNFLGRNDDDDNANELADRRDAGLVTGENDLVPARLRITSEVTQLLNGATARLRVASGATRVRLWTTATKQEAITTATTWPAGSVPSQVFVEGVAPGQAVLRWVAPTTRCRGAGGPRGRP